MEIINNLSDLERKLVTIIQNNNKRGHSPSISELETRLGHNAAEINELINDLIKRNWIELVGSNYVVKNKLF